MRFPTPSVLLATTSTFTLLVLACNLILIESIDAFFSESGGVETLTVCLFLLAIPLWFWAKGIGSGLAGWHVPAILALFAMREMDFDKRFTEQGVLKLRYYTADVPWTDKIAGVLVLLFILLVVATFLRRNLRDWLSRLRQGDTWAWLLGAALAVVTVAKSIDGLGRKLAPFGIDVPHFMVVRAGRIEEMLELAFAILLIQVIAYIPRRA